LFGYNHYKAVLPFFQAGVCNFIPVFSCNLPPVATIKMENRDAIACCLIVHELLTNAIKFAFPHGASGTIHVVLKKLLNQELALSVSDSGIGIPSSYSMETDAKLGLKIVRLLVKQLGGSLEIRNAGGAVFLIKFRI